MKLNIMKFSKWAPLLFVFLLFSERSLSVETCIGDSSNITDLAVVNSNLLSCSINELMSFHKHLLKKQANFSQREIHNPDMKKLMKALVDLAENRVRIALLVLGARPGGDYADNNTRGPLKIVDVKAQNEEATPISKFCYSMENKRSCSKIPGCGWGKGSCYTTSFVFDERKIIDYPLKKENSEFLELQFPKIYSKATGGSAFLEWLRTAWRPTGVKMGLEIKPLDHAISR